MDWQVKLDITALTRAAQLIGSTWKEFRPIGIKVKEASQSVLEAVQKSHEGKVVHLDDENGLDKCCRTTHDLMRNNKVFQRPDGYLDHDQEYSTTNQNHKLNCHILYFLGNTVYNQIILSKAIKQSCDLIKLPQRAESIDWKYWMGTSDPWPEAEDDRVTLEGLVLSEILQAWRDVYGDQSSDLRWTNIAICVLYQVYLNINSIEDIYDPDKFKAICNSVHTEMCLQDLWGNETKDYLKYKNFNDLPVDKQEKIILLVTATISAVSDFQNPYVK